MVDGLDLTTTDLAILVLEIVYILVSSYIADNIIDTLAEVEQQR